jgi:hypothetical protein
MEKRMRILEEKYDTILVDINRKQLIWYGHVERMDPMRLPVITINWKPERKDKTRSSPKNLGRWDIYIAISERGLRMG